ncbi:hypothetical protein [Luteolibacter sp. AS25]|uniref:hypothetical protein n=1 Tax=Luteolibacter sp. AS25 TaxID=3135776 RepID=UPI00398B4A60
MKTSFLHAIIGLSLIASICAEDTVSSNALDEAGNNYLKKIEEAQEEYLNDVRVALRKTTVIEVSRIDYPGKRHPDVFDDGSDELFVEEHLNCEFKILETARIDEAQKVTEFLNATINNKGGDILMFPYFPTIGFRCLAGESELLTATIDLKSFSLRVVFPDGQWTRLGLDIKSTVAILEAKGLQLPKNEPNKSEMATPRSPSD